MTQIKIGLEVQTTDNGFLIQEEYSNRDNCMVATDEASLKDNMLIVIKNSIKRQREDEIEKCATKKD